MDSKILPLVKQFFAFMGWHAQPYMNQENILHFTYEGDNARWTCFTQIDEKFEQLVFYSLLPYHVPEVNRLATMEFITRVNYGMRIGNFEMDLSDGEVRFKTAIGVSNDRMSEGLIRTMVFTNLRIMDKYVTGINEVVQQAVSPELAFEKITMA